MNGRGPTTPGIGDLLTMVISHLLNGMILQVCCGNGVSVENGDVWFGIPPAQQWISSEVVLNESLQLSMWSVKKLSLKLVWVIFFGIIRTCILYYHFFLIGCLYFSSPQMVKKSRVVFCRTATSIRPTGKTNVWSRGAILGSYLEGHPI